MRKNKLINGLSKVGLKKILKNESGVAENIQLKNYSFKV